MNAIQKIITTTHRVLWRGTVIIFPMMISDIAKAPIDQRDIAITHSSIFVIYIAIIAYVLVVVAREYRHPNPDDLGASTDSKGLAIGLAIVNIILSLSWLTFNQSDPASSWPWIVAVWATSFAIYFLRPRISTRKNK